MEWMILPLKRYADFRGRSRRKEYWMFVLFTFLVNFVFLTVMFSVGGGAFYAAMSGGDPNSAGMIASSGLVGIIYLLNLIFSLGVFIPSIAVAVRRLHDTNRSGWWLLAPLVPYVVMLVGGIAMFSTFISGNGGANSAIGMSVMFGLCGLAFFVLMIMLIVFMCLDGTRGPNRFGPDPKNPEANLEEVFS